MKTLTRIFFCTFTVVSFYSCEPEEISESLSSDSIFQNEHEEIGDTGDQKDEVYTKDETE